MKLTYLIPHLTALALGATLSATHAENPPKPVWLLQGTAVQAGAFKTTVPTGSLGKAEGQVAVENGAIVFSGKPGQINFPLSGVVNGPFTVVARLAPENPTGYGPILSTSVPLFILRVHGHGGYDVAASNWGTRVTAPKDTLRSGETQLVAVVYDGKVLRLFVDGQNYGETDLPPGPFFKTDLTLGGMGELGDDGTTLHLPNYRLFEAALFNTALTKEQLVQLGNSKSIPAN